MILTLYIKNRLHNQEQEKDHNQEGFLFNVPDIQAGSSLIIDCIEIAQEWHREAKTGPRGGVFDHEPQ